MATSWLAQAAQLSAPRWPKWVGWWAGGGWEIQEGQDICTHIVIHFAVQQKLTQYCKTTIPQFKREFICEITHVSACALVPVSVCKIEHAGFWHVPHIHFMIWNRRSTGCTYISLYWSRCPACQRDEENSSWQNPQRSLLLRHWCWQPRCYRETKAEHSPN